MEANPSAFKNSLPFAVGPMKFTEESPKRKTSFMVDDIVNVRDPNSFNSPCSDKCLADSTLRDRAPQTSEGLPLSKQGINRFDLSVFQFIDNRDTLLAHFMSFVII